MIRPLVKAVVVDGWADRAWRDAPSYVFSYSADVSGVPAESGCVRFGWNSKGFYVFVDLEDSCLVSTDRRDERLHFETGDVFELFVKPLNDAYYWEMYATPFGNKSTLFFPRERKGMTVDDFLRTHDFRGLEVFSEKSSNGWKTRMFVPAWQLTALGADWGPGSEWTVFCGRYNYQDKALNNPELSMVPRVSKTDFHLTEEYALLDFHKQLV